MKKELLDALKAKFIGVSENVLSRIADKLAKTATTQEQVATAVEGVTFQQVLESYGDSRATEAQQTAVKNYEAKYGLKDGAKVEQQPPITSVVQPTPQQTGGAAETPAWAQALIDSNKALSDRITKMEGERTTATRRQQLSTIIEKLPEHLRKAYERTPVENLTDEQFATLTAEITTEVEGIVTEVTQKGAVFGKPSLQGAGNQGGELTKEQQEAISHRDSVPTKGQPF